MLNKDVRYLKGVGPKRAEALGKLGLRTVRDVLYHLPRQYEDRRRPQRISDLRIGEKAVIHVRHGRFAPITRSRPRSTRRRAASS